MRRFCRCRVLISFALAPVFVATLTTGQLASAAPANWPSFLLNHAHTSFNQAATAITPDVARWNLVPTWTFPPPVGMTVASLLATPAVYNGKVYIGADDGTFYELNEADGSVIASVSMGTEQPCPDLDGNPDIDGPVFGIRSTATVALDPARGPGAATVYVTAPDPNGGDGGIVLWALDARDLHRVWSTDPVEVDMQRGSFPYASPLVTGGRVYVGIASGCDFPLVRGALKAFDQHTGLEVARYWVVPEKTTNGDPNVGGGVWSTPASAGTSIWVSTGNANEGDDPLQPATGTRPGDSYSIVRLDAATLTRTDRWRARNAVEPAGDHDFGASPTLFSGVVAGSSSNLVGACNKNGIFYALQRNQLSAGPVWRFRVGEPSTEAGATSFFDACLATAVSDNTKSLLFVASNRTANVDGSSAFGSIRALSPDANPAARVIWDDALPCAVLGSPTLNGSGVLAVPTWRSAKNACGGGTATPAVYLFSAYDTVPNANGLPDAPRLRRIGANGSVFGQPVFADDHLFVVSSGRQDGAPKIDALVPGP